MENEFEKEETSMPETTALHHGDRLESRPVLTGRRAFFARLTEIVAGAVAILFAIPLVRYLLYPVGVTGGQNGWSDLGPAAQFTPLKAPVAREITAAQNDGWLQSQSKKPIYITKDAQGRVQVLTAVCPHLGCTVQWSEVKNEFLCPCHGSVFAPDGARIAGPTPRGMDSLPMKTQNGRLMVRYEDFRQLLPVKQVLG